ncbi:hypothetical protein JAAARDRAFT_39446 [Jaapia argillacea MUCL 33604]|uniref:Protein kinase domain-containing protein n=1 Tax=Jaapia argillacea MUCL 33604 TaxID=933084 RepID=A0A067PF25_9AGAM|nr:hypothetical protein JAAARDRAFT_39446 [Jaapia argillacea MUCL 33604]
MQGPEYENDWVKFDGGMDSDRVSPLRPPITAGGPSLLRSYDFQVKSDSPHITPVDLSSRVVVVEGPLCGGASCDIYTGEFDRETGRKEKVAMKQLRIFLNWKDEDRIMAMKLFRREIKIWSSFDHPNILPFYGFATDASRFFLISPWAASGNIMEYLKRCPGASRHALVLQIAKALEYLHGRVPCGYVHGDLKGDNVLISEWGTALVCDFGLTRRLEKVASMTATPSKRSPIGHIRFTAPELFHSDSKPTRESDIFAFACLVIQIFTGQQPYHELSDLQVLNVVTNGGIPPRPVDTVAREAGFTDAWWNLITFCMIATPSQRPAMSVIVGMLASTEFAEQCPTQDIDKDLGQSSNGSSRAPSPSLPLPFDLPFPHIPNRDSVVTTLDLESNSPSGFSQPFRPETTHTYSVRPSPPSSQIFTFASYLQTDEPPTPPPKDFRLFLNRNRSNSALTAFDWESSSDLALQDTTSTHAWDPRASTPSSIALTSPIHSIGSPSSRPSSFVAASPLDLGSTIPPDSTKLPPSQTPRPTIQEAFPRRNADTPRNIPKPRGRRFKLKSLTKSDSCIVM